MRACRRVESWISEVSLSRHKGWIKARVGRAMSGGTEEPPVIRDWAFFLLVDTPWDSAVPLRPSLVVTRDASRGRNRPRHPVAHDWWPGLECSD